MFPGEAEKAHSAATPIFTSHNDRGLLDQISLDRNCLFSVDRKFHFQLIKFFKTFHLIKTFNNAFDQTP